MALCEHSNSPCHRIIKLVIKLSRMHRAVIMDRTKQTGVYRSQHQILMLIAAHPGASQKDIARMQEVSTATIAVTLKKLEKSGYVQRVVDEADNRCNRLQVTEKGQKIVDLSHEIFQKTDEEIFAGFAEEDICQLEILLNQVCTNIEKMAGEDGREQRKYEN